MIFANAKLGTMRIVSKGNKIVAQVVYEAAESQYSDDGNVMGVDLGIKCPAVSYCSDGSVKFYGNGRRTSTCADTINIFAKATESKETGCRH